jgi:deazaflavin-dependent oxidoreductase (nitroreductase family)
MSPSYLDVADRTWWLLGPLMRGHARVYRATGGRVGNLPGLPPLLLLDSVGGKRYTTPLVYMPHGDDFVIVASKGGYSKDPGWMHNLRAHPDTEVQIGGDRIAVRARETEGEERTELWAKAARYLRQWDRYRERTSREIPLVVLERVAS